MKKVVKVFICLLALFLVVGCNDKNDDKVKEELKNITIVIVGNEKEELYNESVETSKEKLVDVLNEEEVSLVIEDGPYGAYITSLMELEQKTTKKGMYYWGYYIDDQYGEVGISNCNVEDGKTYKFVYEYYEN